MVGFLQVQCRADDRQADQPVLPDGQALHHAVGGENVVCIRLVVHVRQAQERCVRAQLQGVVTHQLQLAFHAAGHAREVAALLLPVAVADAAVIGEADDDKQRQADKQEHRIGKGNPRGTSKARTKGLPRFLSGQEIHPRLSKIREATSFSAESAKILSLVIIPENSDFSRGCGGRVQFLPP